MAKSYFYTESLGCFLSIQIVTEHQLICSMLIPLQTLTAQVRCPVNLVLPVNPMHRDRYTSSCLTSSIIPDSALSMSDSHLTLSILGLRRSASVVMLLSETHHLCPVSTLAT